jgi:hypothetical protein
LIVLFGGDTHALTPLFAVGVFLAFTLSQFGMVHHWWRKRGRGWPLKAAINGLGALATGATVLVIGIGRFVEGAWIVVVLIPALVMLFLRIRRHYRQVAEQLSLTKAPPTVKRVPSPRVIIPVPGVHRGINGAVSYAQSIAKDVTAVYVELEPGAGQLVREKWQRWWPEVPLVVLPSPYRSLVGPLLDFLDQTDAEHNDGQLATVVLPEFVPAKWWHSLLHNQTAWLLKAALLYRRRKLGFNRAIIDIPYHLQR